MAKHYTDTIRFTESALSETIVDDFEDGDTTTLATNWDGYTGNTDKLSVTTTALSGTYSGKLTHPGDFATDYDVFTTRDAATTIEEVSYEIELDTQTGEPNDFGTVYLFDSSDGTIILGALFGHDGDVTAGGSTLGTWSANTTYTVDYTNIDYSANTYDVSITGQDLDVSSTGVGFINSKSSADQLDIRNNNGDSTQTVNIFFDDLIVRI